MSQKMKPTTKPPALPKLLGRKIYKTGQTRGADDDVIYQNRVSRASTVLIPYSCWEMCKKPQDGTNKYENGFIVLISPTEYFGTKDITTVLDGKGLKLGSNTLVFFETREQWRSFNPDQLGWRPAKKRSSPLGGQFVARIPATTANDDSKKIIKGFDGTKMKGAGIRVYEYASAETIKKCCLQLEALFWLCYDSEATAISNGMSAESCSTRKNSILELCKSSNLLDHKQLIDARILDKNGNAICPLCLENLSGNGFFSRMEQAEGREVPDLTVTQVNLFHIDELRIGKFGHRPYNIGWGHHHCNVVVKDSGILKTLEWMQDVIKKNIAEGHFTTENSAS